MGFSLCKSGDTKDVMLDWGTYPEVSIAEAARTARIMREQLAAGDDPLEIKKAESEKVVIPTFADAARRVHAELSPGWENPKHGRGSGYRR